VNFYCCGSVYPSVSGGGNGGVGGGGCGAGGGSTGVSHVIGSDVITGSDIKGSDVIFPSFLITIVVVQNVPLLDTFNPFLSTTVYTQAAAAIHLYPRAVMHIHHH
jgi:phosphoribulokinase